MYRRIIMEATGCTAAEVGDVEDIMRDVVFHSTLDWQTHAELVEGARRAYEVYQEFKVEAGANEG